MLRFDAARTSRSCRTSERGSLRRAAGRASTRYAWPRLPNPTIHNSTSADVSRAGLLRRSASPVRGATGSGPSACRQAAACRAAAGRPRRRRWRRRRRPPECSRRPPAAAARGDRRAHAAFQPSNVARTARRLQSGRFDVADRPESASRVASVRFAAQRAAIAEAMSRYRGSVTQSVADRPDDGDAAEKRARGAVDCGQERGLLTALSATSGPATICRL